MQDPWASGNVYQCMWIHLYSFSLQLTISGIPALKGDKNLMVTATCDLIVANCCHWVEFQLTTKCFSQPRSYDKCCMHGPTPPYTAVCMVQPHPAMLHSWFSPTHHCCMHGPACDMYMYKQIVPINNSNSLFGAREPLKWNNCTTSIIIIL